MPYPARIRCCVLVVLATAVPAFGVDAVPGDGARPLTAEQRAFWDGFLREDQLRRAAENRSVDLESAERHFRDARFAEALTAVANHLADHPHHQRGLDLQRDIIACVRCLGIRCTADDILRERR